MAQLPGNLNPVLLLSEIRRCHMEVIVFLPSGNVKIVNTGLTSATFSLSQVLGVRSPRDWQDLVGGELGTKKNQQKRHIK